MLIKSCVAFLFLTGLAAGQPLGAGLKVGVPVTDAFKVLPFPTFAAFNADSHNYTIGPYVELRLPARMAVELDALYRSYDFQGASAHTWEFPIVVKHRLLTGPVHPYFEAGLSFSHLSDINIASLQHRSNYGVVVGGGVELKVLAIRLAPELRYTGWAFRNFEGMIQSQRNQFAILFNIGF